LPLQEEQYDFIVPRSRNSRPAVLEFQRLLSEAEVRRRLRELDLRTSAR
jgi:putative molybdopterin biosynthesis protein